MILYYFSILNLLVVNDVYISSEKITAYHSMSICILCTRTPKILCTIYIILQEAKLIKEIAATGVSVPFDLRRSKNGKRNTEFLKNDETEKIEPLKPNIASCSRQREHYHREQPYVHVCVFVVIFYQS